MQLYALDENDCLIFAVHALKHRDYFCLECNSIVRRRGGDHRHTHYYHLSTVSCHLSGKSMTHLQVQSYIIKRLPPGEGQMEYRFPAINRIADVVWLPQKLVFEIQCSAITAEEVQARNADYSKQGFHVIWILHDNRYNQRRVTAAEKFLEANETLPHYFTNINENGSGFIYDQFSLVNKGLRRVKLNPLPVEISQLTWDKNNGDDNDRNRNSVVVSEEFLRNHKEIRAWELTNDLMFPKLIIKYGHYRKLCFNGDLLEQSIRDSINLDFLDYLNKSLECENDTTCSGFVKKNYSQLVFIRFILSFYLLVKRPFMLLFQMVLERFCR